jgi:hypothetical protein
MGNALVPGRPFTTDAARRAAQRSAEIRRERAATRVAYAETLDLIVKEYGDRGRIGPLMFAAAAKLVEAAIAGEIPEPETALERLRLAETARICHAIGRLEADESTANIAHATVLTDEERRERMARIRAGLPPDSDTASTA